MVANVALSTFPHTLSGSRGRSRVVIAAGFVVEQATYAARGEWSARVNLPLQLSDAVTLVAIAALWRPRAGLLAELLWFWALSASLQAVLTPDLQETFPDVLYFTFFATHSGAIVAACLLVDRPAAGAAPAGGAARAALDRRVRAARRRGLPRDGRQLHVPAPQARERLDPRRVRPVAAGTSPPPAVLAAAVLLVLEVARARGDRRTRANPSAAAPAGRR